MATYSSTHHPRLISYLTLRRAIGVLGISFPVLLITGSLLFGECLQIQASISRYYHTSMRDLFVGILFSIALFMFSYNGYDRRDAIAGNLACIFAIGVAFFPTSAIDPLTYCIPNPIDTGIIGVLHFICATCLFLVLSYFSIFLFTIKEKGPTRMKLKRNRVYRTCGYIMLGSVLLIGIYVLLQKLEMAGRVESWQPVFWLESIALWAFGVSWLVKGNTILTDK